MFGIGFPELLLILAIALMVIGPKRLPEIAKALGRALGEFRRATDEFKQTLNEETRATEIREQIMKGGKIYPPEANRKKDVAEQKEQATEPKGGVNPPPSTLGPRSGAAPPAAGTPAGREETAGDDETGAKPSPAASGPLEADATDEKA